MSWLVEISLRLRLLVLLLAIALIIVGIRSAGSIPLDVFPEFAPPLVEIQTEAPGISTEDVERLVTIPIENGINGIPFVKAVRSKSVLGLSSVRLIFAPGTNLLTARQLVQERLAIVAAQLPLVARSPVILPPLSSLSRCMKIGLWSEDQNQEQMTVLTKWTVRPRLMSIPGVANVAVWGEKEPQLQVIADPDRLRANALTLDQLTQAVRDATAVGAGGFVDTPNQRLAIRNVPPVYTPEQLGEIVVVYRSPNSGGPDGSNGGTPIRISDVAEVRFDHAPPIGDAIINNRPGLLLIVEKQPWANTLDVTRHVEKAMEELKPAMGSVQFDTSIFRPATYIERSIENLSHSMLLGCGLVIVVLILFLYDWRSALISAVAIPLSLIAAVLSLSFRGEAINTMVLAGLVIALGEVVDDAIIDVENILRRLKQNALLESPKSAARVVLDASLEVRSAVVYATIIVVLAFLPVFFLDGLSGAFFRPLAASYILAILASLFVALTVTPAMSLILLPATAKLHRGDGPLVRWLKALYRPILSWLLRFRVAVLASACVLFALAASTIPRLGEELMPNFKETDFLMHWVEKPGIGIDAMDRITTRASEELMGIPGVRNFGSHIGRATVADEVVGPNFTELWISVDEHVDYDATVAQVQSVVDGYPGLYRDLLTYLKERIKEVLTGTSAAIVVRIYGSEMSELRIKAAEVAAQVKSIDGVTTLKVEPQVLIPQIAIKLRPEPAAQFGVTPASLSRSVQALVNGTQVGEVYDGQAIFPVLVRGPYRIQKDPTSIGEIMVDTPSGAQVPLKTVADVSIVPAANEIKREGASRRIDVTCNVAGRDLASVATEIEKAVQANVSFRQGYYPEFLGEYAEAKASRQRMLLLSGIVVVMIATILYIDFKSWKLVLVMLIALPLAILGGVLGVFAGGGIVSLGSLVGFVTVIGIAARNAIMLISHYRHLHCEEAVPLGRELIVQGAEERLAPILMTALTAALALVPLVWTGNLPGQEIEYPMALVILAGLGAATAVNLFLLPVMLSFRPALQELKARGELLPAEESSR
ncbi:MAG: efflux RND transporter permease subunit [Planctomycetota bacterium]